MNVLATAVAVLLGLLLAVVVGIWAVVAMGILDVARRAAAIVDGVRGRSTMSSGCVVVDAVPMTTSGDVLDHAHVGVGDVR